MEKEEDMSGKKEGRSGESLSPGDEDLERDTWSDRTDFMLSCISYSVGLGNLWRFPHLLYKKFGEILVFTVVPVVLCSFNFYKLNIVRILSIILDYYGHPLPWSRGGNPWDSPCNLTQNGTSDNITEYYKKQVLNIPHDDDIPDRLLNVAPILFFTYFVLLNRLIKKPGINIRKIMAEALSGTNHDSRSTYSRRFPEMRNWMHGFAFTILFMTYVGAVYLLYTIDGTVFLLSCSFAVVYMLLFNHMESPNSIRILFSYYKNKLKINSNESWFSFDAKVKSNTDAIVKSLSKRLAQSTPMFRNRVKPMGSTAEGTRVSADADYDYLLKLDLPEGATTLNMDKQGRVSDIKLNTACLNKLEWEKFGKGVDKEEITLDSNKIRRKFGQLLNQILPDLELPEGVQHGGHWRGQFSDVRQHGPAYLLQFVKTDEDGTEKPFTIDLTLGFPTYVQQDKLPKSSLLNVNGVDTIDLVVVPNQPGEKDSWKLCSPDTGRLSSVSHSLYKNLKGLHQKHFTYRAGNRDDYILREQLQQYNITDPRHPRQVSGEHYEPINLRSSFDLKSLVLLLKKSLGCMPIEDLPYLNRMAFDISRRMHSYNYITGEGYSHLIELIGRMINEFKSGSYPKNEDQYLYKLQNGRKRFVEQFRSPFS